MEGGLTRYVNQPGLWHKNSREMSDNAVAMARREEQAAWQGRRCHFPPAAAAAAEFKWEWPGLLGGRAGRNRLAVVLVSRSHNGTNFCVFEWDVAYTYEGGTQKSDKFF
jgi:hypothetical protein